MPGGMSGVRGDAQVSQGSVHLLPTSWVSWPQPGPQGCQGITPSPDGCLPSSAPSQPCLQGPRHLVLVTQRSEKPACRGRAGGTLALGESRCGWGEGSAAPSSHLRGQAPPCWEPEGPRSGPQAAPGFQEHPQSSQITGPAHWPPGSCPLQGTHRQIALKIELGW